MQEVKGYLWTFPANQICITTNGFIKKDGKAVMGRGCAREARDRFPGIDETLAMHIRHHGNVFGPVWVEPLILSFPVKHNWWEVADLDLIRQSTSSLKEWAERMPKATILLPRPGCGNGQLDWADVKPVVSVLPDNVLVISKV